MTQIDVETPLVRCLKHCTEATILILVCLAPWAFGSVDAWARLGLYVGTLVLAILGTLTCWFSDRTRYRYLFCLPSLALIGLILLGLVQSTPLSKSTLRMLAPWEAALRDKILPATPETVVGDSGQPVPLPPLTLSQDPEATQTALTRLVATWVLFQSVLALGATRPAFRRFAMAVLINASLLALVSMLQWLSWNGKVLWVRDSPRPESSWYSGGPFVCHNHLSAYLNVGIGMGLGLLLASRAGDPWFRRRNSTLWLTYAVGLLLVGQLASHSRGGVLAAVVAFGVTALLILQRKMKLGSSIALIPLTVFLFLLATGSLSPFQRLASISTSATSDVRWDIWRMAVTGWSKRPVWGMGFGSFAASVAPFGTNGHGAFAQYGESEYVHMLLEGGLVGFGLGIILLLTSGRLAFRALGAAPSMRDRAYLIGGIFGVLALVVHWLCDFSLHVPGVGVVTVVLFAFLCRFGLDASQRAPLAWNWRQWTLQPAVACVVMILLSIGVLYQGARQARAEYQLWGSTVPAPDSYKPTASLLDQPVEELEKIRSALERAVQIRPNWAEGRVRLGLVLLSLYKREAKDLIRDSEPDKDRLDLLCDPIWLHGIVHSPTKEEAAKFGNPLDHEPVEKYLVPAARAFLEARRCCPVLALPYAELASLDYLIKDGFTSSGYLERALLLAGADQELSELSAVVSVQFDDIPLACKFWKRSLEVAPWKWERIADSASRVVQPERILKDVLPTGNGRLRVQFAERILPQNDKGDEFRRQYFQDALQNLEQDDKGEPAETHRLRAYALARLGEREEALKEMESALILSPTRWEWRCEIIGWLVNWGRAKEANKHVVIGLEMNPQNQNILNSKYLVTQALALGNSFKPQPIELRRDSSNSSQFVGDGITEDGKPVANSSKAEEKGEERPPVKESKLPGRPRNE